MNYVPVFVTVINYYWTHWRRGKTLILNYEDTGWESNNWIVMCNKYMHSYMFLSGLVRWYVLLLRWAPGD